MVTTDSNLNNGIGDRLNRIVNSAIGSMFLQGELAQLTQGAFEDAATRVDEGAEEEITFEYPVGYSASKQPIISELRYKKEDLVQRFEYLSCTTLPINGLYQLAIIVEAAFGDLIRTLVIEYPAKIGSKRALPMRDILDANSIEELHLKAADALLNDLSYRSPRDFATAVEDVLSMNLLECPSFHSYIEMKATRDIYVHNKGFANEAYVAKAGSHARTVVGSQLPVTQVYFLECYECCLKLLEWIEGGLHEKWHSTEFAERKNRQTSSK